MEQFGIEVNVIVETDLSVNEFNEKFIEWVESNNPDDVFDKIDLSKVRGGSGMIVLKRFCEENNLNCSTCNRSYNNYYNENEFKICCTVHGFIDNNHVCIDYESKIF